MKTTGRLSTADFMLKTVIKQISDDETLVHYKSYCERRIEGLRKAAFAELNMFLQNFVEWGAKNGKRVASNVKAYYYSK